MVGKEQDLSKRIKLRKISNSVATPCFPCFVLPMTVQMQPLSPSLSLSIQFNSISFIGMT